MADVLQQIVLDKDRNLELLDFLAYVSYITETRCSKNELLEAFRGLDRDGTGRLQVNDLRVIYTQRNKALENEFDQIIKSLCIINGELDYEDFVSKRFAI